MYTQLDMSRLYKAGYVEAAGGHYTYVDMRRLQEDIYIQLDMWRLQEAIYKQLDMWRLPEVTYLQLDMWRVAGGHLYSTQLDIWRLLNNQETLK